MNERMIQNALYQFRTSHPVMVPNIQMAWGESDFLSVNRGGMVYDHEIKISMADFKADFSNRSVMKWNKHWEFGRSAPTTNHLPNYFLYVAPAHLLTIHDVPQYAGLLHWQPATDGYERHYPFGYITLVKKPPRIHDRKIDQETTQQIARSMMLRYWTMRQQHDPRCPSDAAPQRLEESPC